MCVCTTNQKNKKMASLKVKRRFSDLYNSGSPDQRTVSPTVSPSTCSSFRLQSLDGGNPQQQQKRFRPASPQQQTSSSATNSTSSIQSPSFPRPNTPFEPLGSRRILDALDNNLPRKVRRKMSTAEALQQEVTLTMPEVRDVVQRALEIQEERLRAEYDRVLLQQLREQFESFSRFNQEHVSRQLNNSDFSYCN